MHLVQYPVNQLQTLNGLIMLEPELFLRCDHRQYLRKQVADPGRVLVMAVERFIELAEVIQHS